jgi:hypothetical protein
MKKIKSTMLLAVLAITACAPQRLQTFQLSSYKKDKPYYTMTGYTDLNETAPKSSVSHIKYALSDACPTGVIIDSLQEYPTHNGMGEFLYWETVAGCK